MHWLKYKFQFVNPMDKEKWLKKDTKINKQLEIL